MGPTSKSKLVDEARYAVRVSSRFLSLSLLSCILAAFAVGRTARVILVINPQKELIRAQYLKDLQDESSADRLMKLPNPEMKEGKAVPQTSYTSKNFDTAKSATIHSRWVVTDEGVEQCVDVPESQCRGGSAESDEMSLDVEDDGELHLPKGQHLLVDIANVDGAFLNSEERLANAMLDLVKQCGLTLLSYHCHGLTPVGVSCAGVLLESHVSFHTWPTEGVITLDLFTCGDDSLLPIVPLAKELFAVPKPESDEEPHMMWAHKFRGFGDVEEASELTDLFGFPLGRFNHKEKIVSAETDFQRVDIYDVLRPQFQSLDDYKKSLSVDGSYQATHPEYFEPDRLVFLDGVSQSRKTGDAPYHEALVHPTMFAHKNPKRVAIIGGGEGATLREILKHNTVEKVIMIEIDQQMVELSRKYLPFWSDCSMLEGNNGSCFDDPRVEVYYEDAFAWFIDRYSGDLGDSNVEPFDIIVMDALDPQVQKDFVDALYDGGPFLSSLPKAIAEDGMLVAQVGEGAKLNAPSEADGLNRNRVNFIRSLVDLGFESIVDYDEAHGGFEAAWQILVAFKNYNSRTDWFAPASLVEHKIRERLIPTVDGGSPLRYFDGATMASYMYPSKASEVVFCRRVPESASCQSGQGFDPERTNLPLSVLEVKPSSLGEHAGRGVFAKQDISQMSYLGLERLVPRIHFSPKTSELTRSIQEHSLWQNTALGRYTDGYGHSFSHHGGVDIFVDSTLHCFINHGCKGSTNVGHALQISEENVDADVIPKEILEWYLGKDIVYNPAAERQVHFYSSAYPLQDIVQGEELFDNYLGMTGNYKLGWSQDVKGLKIQCNGGLGSVSEWERS